MAKLSRALLTLFGGTGPNDDFAKFGSQTAGSPVKTKNVNTIQTLPAWGNGWKDAIVSANKAPFLEDMNAVMYVHAYEICYLLQEGIPEYEGTTTYFIGSYVKKPGTNELYSSLVDNNIGNALPSATDNANWKFVYPVRTTTLVGVIVDAQIDTVSASKVTGPIPFSQISGQPMVIAYRRPYLVYVDVSHVDVEAQTGVSNATAVAFPDTTIRTVVENTGAGSPKYRRFDITATANWTSGTEASGLRPGLSETADTWYAIYAVKSQIDATKFVLVGDTTLPIAANFNTLEARYNPSSWVYLGMIRNGCNYDVATSGGSVALGSTAGLDIVGFEQDGAHFKFKPYTTRLITANGGPGTSTAVEGALLLGDSVGTTSDNQVTIWTYATGVGIGQMPDHIKAIDIKVTCYAPASPVVGLVYFGSVSDEVAAQSSYQSVALLRDSLAVLSSTSDPATRSAIVASYFLQLAALKPRLTLKGPNASPNQLMAAMELFKWRAADGIKMFSSSNDGTNFPENVNAAVLLKGWEDPVLNELNNAL